MDFSKNLADLLKTVVGNVRPQPTKQTNTGKTNSTQSGVFPNGTPSFNNGELNPNEEYGGLIQFSSAQTNSSNGAATAQNSGQAAQLQKLLKTLKKPNTEKTQTTGQSTNVVPSPTVDPTPHINPPTIIDYRDETEFGEMGYLLNLLDLPTYIVNYNQAGSPSMGYSGIQKDNEGRVTGFVFSSGQATLNPDVNFRIKYDITYEENGEITVKSQKTVTLNNQPPEQEIILTFDTDGKLVRKESGNTTTVYNNDGGYTETTYNETLGMKFVLDKDAYGRTIKESRYNSKDVLLRINYMQYEDNGSLRSYQQVNYNENGSVKQIYFSDRRNSENGANEKIKLVEFTGNNSILVDENGNIIVQKENGSSVEYDPYGNITKQVFEDGSYAQMDKMSVKLFDAEGNEKMSVEIRQTFDTVLPDYEVSKDGIILKFEGKDDIVLTDGDKLYVKGLERGMTLVNPENGVKVFDKDGNLTSQSSIKPGEKGSFEYAMNLLGLNGKYIYNYGVEYDENGRITKIDDEMMFTFIAPVFGDPRKYTYELNYNDETNEVEITSKYQTSLTSDYTTESVKTFNSEGKLVKLVQGNSTTVYEENGDYTTTIKDGEDVVKTITRTTKSDGTIEIRTDEANGSWDLQKLDENNNLISQEGKAVIAPNSTTTVNFVEIENQNETNKEVTYSIDSEYQMILNADDVKINSPWVHLRRVPVSYGDIAGQTVDSEQPEVDSAIQLPAPVQVPFRNLTIKGDNNEITGSYGDDSVKVIGNNNKVDLKEGEDTLIAIGDNNSADNVENATLRPKTIPEGEVGTLEYVQNLLNLPEPQIGVQNPVSGGLDSGSNEITYSVQKTDDEGRITEFTLSVTTGGIAQVPKTYTISYDKNGNISEIVEREGFDIANTNQITKTYNGEGKLIKEKRVEPSTNTTTEITYGDGITTTVVTVNDPEIGKPLSVEKTYKTDTYESVFKDEYTYDSEGKVTQKVNTIVVDDVQLERKTTNYDSEGVITSETGEITLRANETKFVYPLMITNPKDENATYTYSRTLEDGLVINTNNLEIHPESWITERLADVESEIEYDESKSGRQPFRVLDYSTGATVDITSQSDFERIGNIINPYKREIYIEQLQMSDTTINGNNNTITGSYHDDEMTVVGNNNIIDLADGEDTVNIQGYNNQILHTEHIKPIIG